jgi:hypothetical protein
MRFLSLYGFTIKLLEFDRAEEIIEEGRDCVRRMLPAIQDAINVGSH